MCVSLAGKFLHLAARYIVLCTASPDAYDHFGVHTPVVNSIHFFTPVDSLHFCDQRSDPLPRPRVVPGAFHFRFSSRPLPLLLTNGDICLFFTPQVRDALLRCPRSIFHVNRYLTVQFGSFICTSSPPLLLALLSGLLRQRSMPRIPVLATL